MYTQQLRISSQGERLIWPHEVCADIVEDDKIKSSLNVQSGKKAVNTCLDGVSTHTHI